MTKKFASIKRCQHCYATQKTASKSYITREKQRHYQYLAGKENVLNESEKI